MARAAKKIARPRFTASDGARFYSRTCYISSFFHAALKYRLCCWICSYRVSCGVASTGGPLSALTNRWTAGCFIKHT
jgi:hypothetical protein